MGWRQDRREVGPGKGMPNYGHLVTHPKADAPRNCSWCLNDFAVRNGARLCLTCDSVKLMPPQVAA